MRDRDIDELLRRLPGRSGEADSDLARAATAVWCPPARTRRPAAVVRPYDAEDVAVTMRWANEVGAPVTVRSGGHSFDGLGIRDGLVLIDLSALDRVEIDGDRVVRAGPGARVRDIDQVVAAAGLAVPVGSCPAVGLGGLVTGGGIGFFSRLLGVTSDSLLEATVVLPDGSIVTCDERDHADVFWACRGGAGCAGIVTELAIEPVAVPSVVEFAIDIDWSGFAEMYNAFAEVLTRAPEPLDLLLQIRATGAGRYIDMADVGPPGARSGQPYVAVTGQMVGTVDETLDALAPLLALDALSDHRVELVDFAEAARREVPLGFLDDPSPPTLRTQRLTSDFATAASTSVQAGAIADFVTAIQHDPALAGMGVLVEPANGAIGRTPAAATAFAHRDADLLIQWQLGCPDDVSPDDERFVRRSDELLADTRRRLGDTLTGGRYANYAGRGDTPEALWRENLPRLSAIAHAVDPHALLHSRLRPATS